MKKWESSGGEMGIKLGRNGNQVGKKWESSGEEMGILWGRNGNRGEKMGKVGGGWKSGCENNRN